jgi:FMN phosphatase YigB (HAD superfamily)
MTILSKGKTRLTHKQIDAELLKKARKYPGEIIYIDDKLDNCKAAEKTGMETFHYKINNLGKLRQQLLHFE